MVIKRVAHIESATGKVLNVSLRDEAANIPTPDGIVLIDGTNANPGDTWDGIEFIRPVMEVGPTPEPTIEEKIAALEAKVKAIEEASRDP